MTINTNTFLASRKVKTKLSHVLMKTPSHADVRWSVGMAQHILNLGIRWTGMVSFMPQPTQAVSRRLPSAAARVRDRVRSCGICGTGADFLRVLWFPLPILIPPIVLQSSSSGPIQ
jgi:hypothetical protein